MGQRYQADRLAEAARHSSLTVVPGLEINCDVEDMEIHILGYFADWQAPWFQDFLRGQQAERVARIHCIAERPTALFARERWFYDLRPLRYLSHFITPTSSPIRFAARFFLAPVPPGQEPRLYTEEASEGFWIGPGEGCRRFRSGEMTMAEPAEYALRYLTQFGSHETLWEHHADASPALHAAAAMSVHSHLLKLAKEGRVREEAGPNNPSRWSLL